MIRNNNETAGQLIKENERISGSHTLITLATRLRTMANRFLSRTKQEECPKATVTNISIN